MLTQNQTAKYSSHLWVHLCITLNGGGNKNHKTLKSDQTQNSMCIDSETNKTQFLNRSHFVLPPGGCNKKLTIIDIQNCSSLPK